MKHCFAYTRVSTNRQGERGVSLHEQREAIVRYAERHGLKISEWFEERETAAKRGRRVFGRMLLSLKKGKADGIIIHKIDRSARNLRDWADLGELIDQGIEVHFANESLDLRSRGGRLSADIQAVVAADYVRNLREETKKGIYGRLKQGVYPFPAPLGYRDLGAGKPKELDPAKAPLVRKAFELYASGRFGLRRLRNELERIGLRNRNNGRITLNGLSVLLNNPFYLGLIRLRKTGETFAGGHPPLITKYLFDRVQRILRGKAVRVGQRHDYLFRRLFSCANCNYSLIGERQKGRVYYRCHGRDCPVTGIREDVAEAQVRHRLRPLRFSNEEKAAMRHRLEILRSEWKGQQEIEKKAIDLNLERTKQRLVQLTDAYLDGILDKELFEERKKALLLERKDFEERLVALGQEGLPALPDRVSEFLELAGSACLSYRIGIPEEKRDLLQIITSNRTFDGENLILKLSSPFNLVAARTENSNGRPIRDRPRTLDALLDQIWEILKQQPRLGSKPDTFRLPAS